MAIIETIGSYAGAIVTIMGLAVMVIKPIREGFIKFITKTTKSDDTAEKLSQILDNMKKITEQNEIQSEALVSVIRNTIMHLYYQYKGLGEISAYERENIEKLFKAYKSLGGNSFVADCVEEIRKLPTKM